MANLLASGRCSHRLISQLQEGAILHWQLAQGWQASPYRKARQVNIFTHKCQQQDGGNPMYIAQRTKERVPCGKSTETGCETGLCCMSWLLTALLLHGQCLVLVAVDKPGQELGHGLDSVVEVLGFIIGLIVSDGDANHSDLSVFGLELMNIALNSGTSGTKVRHLGPPCCSTADDLPASLYICRWIPCPKRCLP